MISPSLSSLSQALRKLGDPERQRVSQSFFKTGKGEYAEGDLFIGVTVPNMRKLVKMYRELPLSEVLRLLKSKIHEERFCALLILVSQYTKGDIQKKTKIYQVYLKNLKWVNNWDLVDTSAPYIVGGYLLEQTDRRILEKLIRSKNLWERRVAIVSTFTFIRAGETEWTLRLTEQLLSDPHDLLHKAAGWMLRELGKRNDAVLRKFLHQHAAHMPRTMLRYAIERFPETDRKRFLKL